jgi:hypothetical protein
VANDTQINKIIGLEMLGARSHPLSLGFTKKLAATFLACFGALQTLRQISCQQSGHSNMIYIDIDYVAIVKYYPSIAIYSRRLHPILGATK